MTKVPNVFSTCSQIVGTSFQGAKAFPPEPYQGEFGNSNKSAASGYLPNLISNKQLTVLILECYNRHTNGAMTDKLFLMSPLNIILF